MVQAVPHRPLTFDQFLALYPDDGERYELRNGACVALRPIGPHEEVIALIRRKLDLEIDRLNSPWFIPQTCLVRPEREGEGYLPDIIVLDQAAVKADPDWKKHSSICKGSSVKLIVEVVSTNWQDDYLIKLAEYEKLGIPEYWIADYRALGGVRYIGSPKTPTLWIHDLVEGEYAAPRSFRNAVRIESQGFPQLELTLEAILQSLQ